ASWESHVRALQPTALLSALPANRTFEALAGDLSQSFSDIRVKHVPGVLNWTLVPSFHSCPLSASSGWKSGHLTVDELKRWVRPFTRTVGRPSGLRPHCTNFCWITDAACQPAS